jgi:hypothetical protein
MDSDNQSEQTNNSPTQVISPDSVVPIPTDHEIAQRAALQLREGTLSPIETRQLNGILAYEEKRRNHLFYAIYGLTIIVILLYSSMVYWVYAHGIEKDSWHILLILAIPAATFTLLIMKILSKPETKADSKEDSLIPVINLIKEFKGLADTVNKS